VNIDETLGPLKKTQKQSSKFCNKKFQSLQDKEVQTSKPKGKTMLICFLILKNLSIVNFSFNIISEAFNPPSSEMFTVTHFSEQTKALARQMHFVS
jgi:hypothetical protein